MRRSVWSVVAGFAVAGVALTPAFAVDPFVTEPFDTAGAVPSGWIVSGTVTPTIEQEVSDTPEYALRLTRAQMDQAGFALYDTEMSTAQGLDITFHQAQFGSDESSEADGIVFFLKDATNTDNVPGGSGGGLGYIGLPGAVLGIALDGYGNFASGTDTDSPCHDYSWDTTQNVIVAAGGEPHFCLLADTVKLDDEGLDPLINYYATRADADRTIRVVIDPVTAPDARVKVYYDGELVLDIKAPATLTSVENVKLGFSAGTGGSIDKHDIWGVGAEVADPTYTAPDNPAGSSKLAATGVDPNVLGLFLATGLLALAVGAPLMRRRTR